MPPTATRNSLSAAAIPSRSTRPRSTIITCAAAPKRGSRWVDSRFSPAPDIDTSGHLACSARGFPARRPVASTFAWAEYAAVLTDTNAQPGDRYVAGQALDQYAIFHVGVSVLVF